jgi:hypothetical protein
MGKALHGKARIDRNTRGESNTSAKTDVFIHEFLRDSVGMKDSFSRIRSNPKYRKKDGGPLSISTIKSWYGNWSARTAEEVRDAIDRDDWSVLKSYYPAAVEGREKLLVAALEKIEAIKKREAFDYYFYNTDGRAIFDEPRPRFPVLIDKGFAAAGGATKYGKRFAQLAQNDILLMYENGVGVVAIGRVKEPWDGVTHSKPLYYTDDEMKHLDGGANEYRIAVDWFVNLSQAPLGVEEIKNRLGNTPRGVVRRIVEKRSEVAKIIDELSNRPPLVAVHGGIGSRDGDGWLVK